MILSEKIPKLLIRKARTRGLELTVKVSKEYPTVQEILDAERVRCELSGEEVKEYDVDYMITWLMDKMMSPSVTKKR